ncbi:MAG: SDR family oxidoreductase [Spirochaetia bacterium]
MSGDILDLSGTSAVITGASSGIGRECALLLAGLGTSIVVADIAADAGKNTEEEIGGRGGRAKFVLTDVTDGAHVERLFSEAATASGSVDALVHCAGVMSTTPVMEIGMQEWERVMSISLGATFFCAR